MKYLSWLVLVYFSQERELFVVDACVFVQSTITWKHKIETSDTLKHEKKATLLMGILTQHYTVGVVGDIPFKMEN